MGETTPPSLPDSIDLSFRVLEDKSIPVYHSDAVASRKARNVVFNTSPLRIKALTFWYIIIIT